ncbi:unnamed protein product [Blepharisma stoltei]|uniref:C2H2-type domain-containing protein n=1 Tax=Blepharisma stoltei TaxID=1481888 RepID=A0AAU9JHT7_9CILI|nr:unnamed protein product [Blepharisma stoltei]
MEETLHTSHHLIQGLRCDYSGCGKILSSKYNLKRHIESCHYGYRPYECPVCFKRFSSKQNKREHVRLEHNYSHDDYRAPTSIDSRNVYIGIPKLTSMLLKSQDPDIRPLSRIERFYLYAEAMFSYHLYPVETERMILETDLPSFEATKKMLKLN